MDDKIAKRITHEEYINMYSTVRGCLEWSTKLRDVLGVHFTRFNNVDVPKDFLQKMREAARTEGTQRHIDVLNEVFGKEEPQPKFKVGDWVRIVKEWCPDDRFNKDTIHQIDEVKYNERLDNIYYHFHTSGNCKAENIEPWIPEVGEWVVADDKGWVLKVQCVATHDYKPTTYSSYYVDAENENTRYCITSYPVKHLRPATKEEVEKAKGEGDLFFNEEGVEALANLIYHSTYMDSINWYRLPGKNKNEKAEWINKTITKALKDERLW